MRKILLFMALVTVLAPVTLGQLTATVGSTACSPTSTYIPWYNLYDYSEAQYGIPAAQMAALGATQVTITQLGWYCCGTLPTGNYSLRVYLSQVPSSFDLSTLCSTSIDNFANGTLVASNKILTGSGNIKSLVLDTPYTYTPGNHLIVTTCDTLSGWGSTCAWAGNSMTGNGRYRYRDGTVYDCNMATNEGGTNGCANQWMTTWFTYTSAGPTCNLTMLAPGGTGAGTVSPAVGTHTYPQNNNTPISATSNFGSEFDRWELDGAFYSYSASTTVLMDVNHTVQAFFKPTTPLPLPFTEDFTGVPTGTIPVGWFRTHTNWGVGSSANAGGVAPEMVFSWSSGTNAFRLITPKLNGQGLSHIDCIFKHYVNHYTTPYNLRVQTSTDNGATWQTRWSVPGASMSGEVTVDLDALIGQNFMVAFVFDGDAYNINYWYIDDIYIGPPPVYWDLDMLNPVGRGAVYPAVGLHDMIMDGTEQILGALPSEIWYAVDLYPNYYNPFEFNPADYGTVTYLGTNSTPIFAGTWADDLWYAVSYNPADLYTINTETGALTLIGPTGQNQISGIAYDEDHDIMYASTGTQLYSIDRWTGTLTPIGPFGGSLSVIDIAYGGGVLYAHCIATDGIYTVDVNTGAAALLGPTGINANYAQGMEFDKDHDRLFLALADLNYAYLAEVDKTDGSIFTWFQFIPTEEVDGFAIPYNTVHLWEFDRWEVDGDFYTNDPVTSLPMHNNHSAQAFFVPANPINCVAVPNQVFPGQPVLLLADSFFDIYWYDDMCGGHLIGIGSPLTVYPTETRTYYARAYDPVEDEWSGGCCDVLVTVNPPPVPPDPTNCEATPEEICVGGHAYLEADSIFDVFWYDDFCGGNLIGTGSPLVIIPTETKTYYARAYDPIEDEWSVGCCDVTVTVHDLPIAEASNNSTASTPISVGGTLELYGGPDGMDEYHWQGPGGWESYDQNPTRSNVDPTMAGGYYLTVTDVYGCVGSAATTVYIGPPPPIPTMGVTGIGLLLLALGSLMSFARRRK
ncbi:MAG: hypothetical protein WBM27_02140 [bacterium]